MKVNISKNILALLFPLLLSACSLDIPIEDRVADPNAVTDATSARRALATAYSSYCSWQYMIPFSAMSDDFMPSPTLPKNTEFYGWYNWREQQLIELSQNIWNDDYQTIMYANTILERLSSIKPTSEEERQGLHSVKIEALALKALCYFHVMQIFSPRYIQSQASSAPGVVNKTKVGSSSSGRLSLAETADTIRNMLAPCLVANVQSPPSKSWISKLTSRCLAADLELWTGNYEKVIQLCEPVIKSMSDDVFGKDVYQSLWEQSGTDCRECLFNIDYAPFIGLQFFDNWNFNNGDYLVVNDIVRYEDNDIRRQPSVIPFKFPINFGATYRDVCLLGKYNAIRLKNQNIRYISSYRMSDFVFLCSEAYARTGNADKAIKLMNRYLAKRGVTEIKSGTSGGTLIDRILSEKQKEFLGEGRRFFDLKRLGIKVLGRNLLFESVLTYIQSDDFRWTLPIPASEYRYNPVVQNRGWERLMNSTQP